MQSIGLAAPKILLWSYWIYEMGRMTSITNDAGQGIGLLEFFFMPFVYLIGALIGNILGSVCAKYSNKLKNIN